MSNVNRILTFIIGLIVLVILLLFINSRLNSKNSAQEGKGTPTPTQAEEKKGFDFFGLFRKNSPTPTASVTPTQKPTGMAYGEEEENGYGNGQQNGEGTQDSQNETDEYPYGGGGTGQDAQNGGNDIQEIPKTGAPTLLIPAAFSALAGGLYLRRSRKK